MGFITEDAITDIIEVWHLNTVKENGVFEFDRITDYGTASDNGTTANVCAMSYFCALTNDCRCADIRRGSNFRISGDIDAFAGIIVFLFRERFPSVRI